MSNHYKMSRRLGRRRSRLSERSIGLIALTVIGGLGLLAFASGNNGYTSAKPPKSQLETIGQRVPSISIAPIIDPPSEAMP
jgi:hypothetical protein